MPYLAALATAIIVALVAAAPKVFIPAIVAGWLAYEYFTDDKKGD